MADAPAPRHDDPLVRYYDLRAREYEDIYRRDEPQRRAELAGLAEALRAAVAGRRALEVACGTGYWTALAAESAAHVTALDLAPAMLEEARAKRLPADRVTFRAGDAFAPCTVEAGSGDSAAGTARYDAAFAMFWLSHVSRSRVPEFLDSLLACLAPGAVFFLADNMHLEGVGGELVRRPGSVDTWKSRTLADGSRHQVLKNYFTAEELRTWLAPRAAGQPEIRIGRCFWRAKIQAAK